MFTENELPEKPLVTGPITIDSYGNIAGIAGGWNAIKIAQRTFQEKYCKSCIHYNQTLKDFKQKGHPGTEDPDDCFYHWTDPLGSCCNYRPV